MSRLIIVTAPSGSGKTTIVRHLLNTFEELSFSISATTRPPRPHEIDGEDYYFGGYFAGKLLSPHVVLHDDPEVTASAARVAQLTAGNFLSNFIDLTNIKEADKLTVASEAIKAYLRICPWYKAYLLKFFTATTDAEAIADHLIEHYVVSLCESGQISRTGEQFTVSPDRTEGPPNVEENIIKAIARFWSFGAIEHGNDHRFGDYYFDKADATIKRLDPESLVWRKIVQRFGLVGQHEKSLY